MGKALNILVVEDEFLTLNRINQSLIQLGYHPAGSAMSADEAVKIMQTKIIDLAILDISIQGQKDGFWLANFIKNNFNFPFIFLTAYSSADFINKASAVNPSAYLIKPFNLNELHAAIEIAIANFQKNSLSATVHDYIIIKSDGVYRKVNHSDILFLESDANYLSIHLADKKIICRMTMKMMTELLPEDLFVQTHRAFMVNKLKIEKIRAGEVYIQKHLIPVSKSYKATLSTIAHSFREKKSRN